MDQDKILSNSFKRIRYDIDSLREEFQKVNNVSVTNDKILDEVIKEVHELTKKIDNIARDVDLLKGLPNQLSLLGKELNGKSSKRSRGYTSNIPTDILNQGNPLVSYGTSTKSENHRRNRICQETRDEIIKQDSAFLNDIYEKVVREKGLCSKTTFYRVIKDMVNEQIIVVYLEKNKRKIKVQGKVNKFTG